VVASLQRRLVGVLSLQSLVIVVTAAQELILVPLYLLGWGAELFRDWLVVMAAAEFFALLDLGLHTYFANLFMACGARGDFSTDYRRAQGLAVSAYTVLMGAGLLSLFATAALGTQESVHTLLGVSAEESLSLLVVLGLGVVLRMPLSLFTGVYRARGEPARAVAFELLYTAGRIVGIVGAGGECIGRTGHDARYRCAMGSGAALRRALAATAALAAGRAARGLGDWHAL